MLDRIECDVLVVGGGVNGTGIARDAAGRGLKVVLCEKDDLGAHTSSASSKLIHGGLRYLEHKEFRLVRKALREREVLLQSAPHIMWPLRFVMPHDAGQRPAWMIRAGLFLYDHLAKRDFLPGSRGVRLDRHPAGAPLQPAFRRGFEYSDGWVDDARLVVLNAVDARERGATILTRTMCGHVQRGPQRWEARLADLHGRRIDVSARCLVNASGPWAETFQRMAVGTPSDVPHALRLIKGSHIVVPKLFDHPYAYIFQHPDGRIVFALPYERDFTLIGTTDVDFTGNPGDAAIGADEVGYLCELASRYFAQPVTPASVVWSFAGVRPILEDASRSASAATRDFRLDHDTNGAPMLTVWGGKITTFRKLAEQAVDWIAPALGHEAPAWTEHAVLPGGDLFGAQPSKRSVLEFETWMRGRQLRYPWLSQGQLLRYARSYGTRMAKVLEHVRGLSDMGPEIVPDLYAAEVYYLMTQEFAQTAEDILWRRTKLGLHVPPGSVEVLERWMRKEAS
ncbi:glycerol-3-phosphate dehydrogenase [Massilia arenosa]|uniref:Glycerol-3-phosphate dehydrogenase n=2 Tax=Zemynaea arenosa TaxID=2561931 RepID=A0A4Y9SHG4_9BURK|nr:glycerol-3-phosphate dehydrogenase [Massilia arenosa]